MEILSKTGQLLKETKAESLIGADLSGADLRCADLIGANLTSAKGVFTFNFEVKLKVLNKKAKL